MQGPEKKAARGSASRSSPVGHGEDVPAEKQADPGHALAGPESGPAECLPAETQADPGRALVGPETQTCAEQCASLALSR